MGVESDNFCLNYGYHLDNWVVHPHQEFFGVPGEEGGGLNFC